MKLPVAWQTITTAAYNIRVRKKYKSSPSLFSQKIIQGTLRRKKKLLRSTKVHNWLRWQAAIPPYSKSNNWWWWFFFGNFFLRVRGGTNNFLGQLQTEASEERKTGGEKKTGRAPQLQPTSKSWGQGLSATHKRPFNSTFHPTCCWSKTILSFILVFLYITLYVKPVIRRMRAKVCKSNQTHYVYVQDQGIRRQGVFL